MFSEDRLDNIQEQTSYHMRLNSVTQGYEDLELELEDSGGQEDKVTYSHSDALPRRGGFVCLRFGHGVGP